MYSYWLQQTVRKIGGKKHVENKTPKVPLLVHIRVKLLCDA